MTAATREWTGRMVVTTRSSAASTKAGRAVQNSRQAAQNVEQLLMETIYYNITFLAKAWRGSGVSDEIASGHDHSLCIDTALAAAADLCRRRSARFTPLRRRVLELVWGGHAPVGAY